MTYCKYAFWVVLGLAWSASAHADLNIAVITPTSGDYKYFSEELINGAKVAVDEINESGGLKGKKINLVQIDDPCDDALSLTTAQMIAVNRSEEDKMHLILGHHCDNQAEKIAAIYSNAGILQIHPVSVRRDLYKKKYSGMVDLVGFSEQQGEDFFNYYTNTYPDTRLSLVYDGKNADAASIAREIQGYFAQAGMNENLSSLNISPFFGDSSRIVRGIQNGGANAVLLLAGADLTLEVSQLLKSDNPQLILFTNRYLGGKKFARKMGRLAEGTHIISLPSLSSNPNFAENLVKLRLWGIEPEGLMVYGYLSVKMWEKLVNSSNSFAYKNIIRHLDKQPIATGWGNVVYTDGIPDHSLKHSIYRFERGGYTQVY